MNSLNVHDASDVTCTLSAAWREMMIVNFVSDNTGKLQNLRQTNKEKKQTILTTLQQEALHQSFYITIADFY